MNRQVAQRKYLQHLGSVRLRDTGHFEHATTPWTYRSNDRATQKRQRITLFEPPAVNCVSLAGTGHLSDLSADTVRGHPRQLT
jgi:hypothetical protein